MPLYAGATGKAMLAFLNPKQQEAAFAEPHLPEFVERAEEAKERARQEIATIRRRGYAAASRELSPDVNGIAAPIFDRFGRPVAAITIGGPSSRFDDDAAARSVMPLLETANELSVRLGYNAVITRAASR
jgi:DNA-binding IclR family transcriptional regulator